MRRWMTTAVTTLLSLTAVAGNRIWNPQVKTLQAVVNQDWQSSTAILRIDTDDVLDISFDEMSHDYHRYTYLIERHEADWSIAHEVFESDWLEGFNGIIIEDAIPSVNTVVPYTHYHIQIPNHQCRLKMSGNYCLRIIDDDTDKEIASVDFLVAEQTMSLALEATTNTDIDVNQSHQQLDISLRYEGTRVTNPEEQIMLVVTQNGRDDNRRQAIEPTLKSSDGLQWRHCRQLIFESGNEYRKYEVLDPSHPTMGIDHIVWDGQLYQVFPFIDEPRPNYIYDEDADGAFYIRNSDNSENDTSCEYVMVNYRLKAPKVPEGTIIINGHWTTEAPDNYTMAYDEEEGIYIARILQKQGYYSYQYLWQTVAGKTSFLPSEGDFYQTENRYLALVYYKGQGDRTWTLKAFRGIQLGSSGEHGKTWR